MFLAAYAGALAAAASVLHAELPQADRDGYTQFVAPFLKQHCSECHGGNEPEAGLTMASLSGDLLAGGDADAWQKIADKLTLGEMPPDDQPRPAAKELARVLTWLREELRKAGKSTIADKLQDPAYGNYVDHTALFAPRDSPSNTATASPPRLWRLNPHVYMAMADDLSRQKDYAQPFAFEGGDGLRDYSALYSIDEPTTDLLIRNAQQIAGWQMWHTVEPDGKLKGGFRSLKEALAIIDPAIKQPTRAQYEALVRKQFELALLREPNDEELTRFVAFAERTGADAGVASGVRMTLASVLLLPEAVFRLELGDGKPDEHGRMLLAPRELAYAISCALTDRRPDNQLLSAANDGKLASRDDVRREVERMLHDDKIAKPRILRFFREFFGYEAAVDVFKERKDFEEHEPHILVSDTDQLIQYILAQDKDVLRELLTTNKSFVNFRHDSQGDKPASDKRRVQFSYNLPKSWKWTADQPIELPREERAGILTQPSWLVAHSLNFDNHAIHRGKWVRERLLGGTVPDLPITVDAQLPEDPTHTLRERMSVTTEKYCWQCHVKMNPLGLPFEIYDHFGRFRTTELNRPVDAAGAVAIGDKTVDGDVHDAIEMIRRLAASKRVQQVFVRHAFRFWMGRNETPADAPTLIAANEAYEQSGGSMHALITSLLTSDAFIYRYADASVKND